MAALQISPLVVWPWRLRHLGDLGPWRGAACIHCDRDVAVPADQSRRRPVCLYCGLERGLVEAVDRPLA